MNQRTEAVAKAHVAAPAFMCEIIAEREYTKRWRWQAVKGYPGEVRNAHGALVVRYGAEGWLSELGGGISLECVHYSDLVVGDEIFINDHRNLFLKVSHLEPTQKRSIYLETFWAQSSNNYWCRKRTKPMAEEPTFASIQMADTERAALKSLLERLQPPQIQKENVVSEVAKLQRVFDAVKAIYLDYQDARGEPFCRHHLKPEDVPAHMLGEVKRLKTNIQELKESRDAAKEHYLKTIKEQENVIAVQQTELVTLRCGDFDTSDNDGTPQG